MARTVMKCSSYCRHESRDCVGGCEGGVSLKKKKEKKKRGEVDSACAHVPCVFFGDGR